MWLFMLFALVIIEMVTETKKENARRARVERVLKQTGSKPEDYLPRKYDSEKWLADLDARTPEYVKLRDRMNSQKNSNNSAKQ